MAFDTRNLKTSAADDGIAPLATRFGSISGRVFDDLDGDGIQDPGENGLKNRFVFLDTNRNGTLDVGEPFAQTRADGSYTIKKAPAGDYDIVETVPKGWHATSPFIEGEGYTAAVTPYKFVEIAKFGGEMVFGDTDDGYAFLEAVNGVTFYGQSHIDISISVNGFLTFASNPTEKGFLNQQLPDPTAPNTLIAPLWDDYILGDTGKVYTLDDSLHGRVVIEWKDVSRYGDTSGAKYTFETILYDDGSIKFMYKNVPTGGTATVGVENEDGTVATQIAYNQVIDAQTGYVLTPYGTQYGKTTIHVDAGDVLTGVDFGQTKNVHAPSIGMHAFDLGAYAPMIAHAHDLALA